MTLAVGGCVAACAGPRSDSTRDTPPVPAPTAATQNAMRADIDATLPVARGRHSMLAEGRNTFRFDTFGDESFWGDTLKLHEAI